MFCSEHFTGKLDFFTSHFHYNLYLKWIISIISYILSLWNLFETKIVANGALDPFKNLLYSSPENKFSITGELTAPCVKSLYILYYKIFGGNIHDKQHPKSLVSFLALGREILILMWCSIDKGSKPNLVYIQPTYLNILKSP